jgi:C-terminal processing protease CtpA/Prc
MNIKKLILERHFDVNNPDQDYAAWLALVDRQTPSLTGECDLETFEAGVNELLRVLGTSHTGFFHKHNNGVPAPGSINATLRAVDGPDGKRWMFLDVIEDGAAFLAGIRPGELLFSIDSVPIVPPRSANFKIGASYQVGVETLAGGKRHVTVEVPNRAAKDRPPMVEPRSLSSLVLTPEIGLVKVATFPGAVGQSFAKELDHILGNLKSNGVIRLIVDLRGNIGGGLGSLRLLSYLCPGKMEIGYSLTRRGLQKGYKKEKLTRIGKIPATKVDLLLMAARFKIFQRDRSLTLVTEGFGPQPFHGRIVILINEYTRSGGEMVASFAKENRLATLVGTRTAGEVLGAANFTLPAGYILRMPLTGWYSWEGECIEGKGVEPEVKIENSLESLGSGLDEQLRKAIAVVEAL